MDPEERDEEQQTHSALGGGSSKQDTSMEGIVRPIMEQLSQQQKRAKSTQKTAFKAGESDFNQQQQQTKHDQSGDHAHTASSTGAAQVPPQELSVEVRTLLENFREAARRQDKAPRPLEIEVRGEIVYRESPTGEIEVNTLHDGLARSIRKRFAQHPTSRPIAERKPPTARVMLAGEEQLRVEDQSVVLNNLKGYLPIEQLQPFAAEVTQAAPLPWLTDDDPIPFQAEQATVGQKWSKEVLKENISRKAEAVSFVRNRRIVVTAAQLLQTFGKHDGNGEHVLHTQQYTIRAQSRELTIQTRTEETLFRSFKTRGGLWYNSIDKLTADQKRDFLVAQRLTRQQALSEIPRNSVAIKQQLGNLTPLSDSRLLDHVNGHKIIQIASHYLNVSGIQVDEQKRRALDGPLYHIEESATGMKITAKRQEQPHVILHQEHSVLTVNLTSDDIQNFKTIAREISGQIRTQAQVNRASPTTTKSAPKQQAQMQR